MLLKNCYDLYAIYKQPFVNSYSVDQQMLIECNIIDLLSDSGLIYTKVNVR